ncbi:HN1_G0039930.mRNA.1.CDS.1 [Saccharomyces cerevisiae]|nr:HN1_G0039930.mRNA.1.CDS.1 [Saccharomyces cerevisiae]CAI4767356.1 BAL_1a_G0050810.mRNA.1.CDS.1 [Saccharomyces cerevisiae]CAI7349223.1 BAL_1a_G0050810.mRNA.1.CDS.1 [Saccharomyces cerevisiae]
MLQSVVFFALLTFASSVSAIYSNNTVSTTTTLAPGYSLVPQETTISYADDTTTFFVTSTVYSTSWFTSTSATITNAASSSLSSSSASGSVTPESTHEITSTSTITSTLLLTLHDSTTLSPSSTAASVSDEDSNNKDAKVKSFEQASTSNGCVPITKFVTVTNEPVTQYVTVTPNTTTQYVTVTGAPSVTTTSPGNVQWYNTTSITNSTSW